MSNKIFKKYTSLLSAVLASLILISSLPFSAAASDVPDENSKQLTGWQISDGVWYYYDETGVMHTNWLQIGDAWYFFDVNGAMLTGWQSIGGQWYYFNEGGVMITGWLLSDNVWYYMGADGAMTTGWQSIDGQRYYFDKTGVMTTGWVVLESGRYYMSQSGIMHTGWLLFDGNWYYLTSSGEAQIGWAYIDGVRYMFDGHGKMIEGADKFIIDVSKWQGDVDWDTLSKTGIDGVIVRTSHGSETKDSKFAEYISELNRLSIPYGLYHYNTATTVEEARAQAQSAIEFVKTTDANPTMPFFVDVEQDGGTCDLIAITKVYIEEFIKNGYKPGIYSNTDYWTNYLDDPEFDLYYKWVAKYGVNDGTADPNYSSKEKLQDYMMWQYTDKGSLEGLPPKTNVDCNILFNWYGKADGWKLYNDNWYYFNSSGAMLTGWQYINNNWYFLSGSGKMLTGWQSIGGVWYYFDASGVMLTGWQYIGSWYYFNSSGAMVSGWQLINGTWYYFNAGGAMLTGWQLIGGAWYYFYDSGAMAANCYVDGYWINESGVWV